MTTPQNHYDKLLARHYSWMAGVPFAHKVEEQTALLRRAGVKEPGVAVDLGCGPGFQTIALANLGARRIHAIDTSADLLTELSEHVGNHPVRSYEADLTTFDRLIGEPADTVVCMGDTLTHLPNRDVVAALFGKIGAALRPGGRLVVSWRDLSAPPRETDRFIPLRACDHRIMVCFLEDAGHCVIVHDLVHVRTGSGWQFHKSAYPKLKLSGEWMRCALADARLMLSYEEDDRGMIVVSATASAEPSVKLQQSYR